MKIGLLLSDSNVLLNEIPSIPGLKIAWLLSKPSIANRKPDIITLYEMENYPEPLESVDVLEVYGDASSLVDEIVKLMKYTKIITFQTPLSIDNGQLQSLIRSAKDQSTMILFAHPFLYSKFIRGLKQSIDTSVIGELQSIYIRTLTHRTDPFWYHLLVLYLTEEIPVSLKCMQNEHEEGLGTKYFFMKFKENKKAKAIQHYATIHMNYAKRSKNEHKSQGSDCEQLYLEAIGSNGVLYFNTDLLSGSSTSLGACEFVIDETLNSKIPILQAIVDGTEIKDIIQKINEVPYKMNLAEEKLKFYENLLGRNINHEKISRLFKDALLFKAKIIQSMNSTNEIIIDKSYWN